MVDKEKVWEIVEEEIRRLPQGWKVSVLQLSSGELTTHVFSGPTSLRGAEVMEVFWSLEDFYANTDLSREELGLPGEAEGLSPREVVDKYEEELLNAYRELFLQGEI